MGVNRIRWYMKSDRLLVVGEGGAHQPSLSHTEWGTLAEACQYLRTQAKHVGPW